MIDFLAFLYTTLHNLQNLNTQFSPSPTLVYSPDFGCRKSSTLVTVFGSILGSVIFGDADATEDDEEATVLTLQRREIKLRIRIRPSSFRHKTRHSPSPLRVLRCLLRLRRRVIASWHRDRLLWTHRHLKVLVARFHGEPEFKCVQIEMVLLWFLCP